METKDLKPTVFTNFIEHCKAKGYTNYSLYNVNSRSSEIYSVDNITSDMFIVASFGCWYADIDPTTGKVAEVGWNEDYIFESEDDALEATEDTTWRNWDLSEITINHTFSVRDWSLLRPIQNLILIAQINPELWKEQWHNIPSRKRIKLKEGIEI